MKTYTIEVSPISHFFVVDTRSALLWLVLRVYLGWQWLSAGWGKIQNPAWVGDSAGAGLTGFVNGALEKATGAHPAVLDWYAAFLRDFVLPNVTAFSYMFAF